ncbi:beta-1,3-glucosyltransferase-like, partial [Anoplophora glabripennis]|uniref:beta-1,3-glucosyltransferase-like n=1 Tax=Anoplophora glabripennis TaxID=217634 RepID=UPI000C784211
DDPIPNSSLYFAVKTCDKYHKDRIPVVKDTWAKQAKHIHFFSNVKDESVPTIDLGVPNTEQGHCGKTMAILRYIAKDIRNDTDTRWIVVADDDTILSVSRFQQLLTCYDDAEDVAVGERYGYNVHSPRGYNYITGGGGMVFSRPLLDKLAENGACECPSLDTPDDMFLGICMAGLGVSVTHSPFFHQ